MGIMTMGNFHQRRGDQSLLSGLGAPVYRGPGAQGDGPGDEGYGPGIWGRVFGFSGDLGANARLDIAGYGIGPQFDGNYWGLQLGSDIAEIEQCCSGVRL